jgi:hypothetical protein
MRWNESIVILSDRRRRRISAPGASSRAQDHGRKPCSRKPQDSGSASGAPCCLRIRREKGANGSTLGKRRENLMISQLIAAGVGFALTASSVAAKTLQYLAPPCDIPGLSQDQYSLCMEHLVCETFATEGIRAGKQGVQDPQVKWAYAGCLASHKYRFPTSDFYWVIEPHTAPEGAIAEFW